MKFGLEEKHLHQLENLLFVPLKEAGFKIWIFGSRARGDHRPYSDIDFLIERSNEVKNFSSLISTLKEALEESSLPYKVDLVDIRDLAESYKEKVLKERIEIT